MAYQKQSFTNLFTILTAEHLEHIEDGIYQNSIAIDILNGNLRIAEINLLAANWKETDVENKFSQDVFIEGITENSQVDLTPSADQLVIFYEKDLALVAENDGGNVTVYAIGQKPINDYTIQVTITEVAV